MNLTPVSTLGGVVVSIELARARSFERKPCEHTNVIVDRDLASIQCKSCGEKLNPVEWIARLGERWAEIEQKTARYRQAIAEYAAKQRARCEHCQKLTRVRPPSPAEVKKFHMEQSR